MVAFPSAFYRMTGNGEGIFRLDDYVIVNNLPESDFNNRRGVLIALTVKGTRQFKTALGERTMVYGDYVSSMECESRGCVSDLTAIATDD